MSEHFLFFQVQSEKNHTWKAEGNTDHAIGQELNRSPHSIKTHTFTPGAIVEISAFKVELAGMFENLAERLLNSITDNDIEKLSAYQRTISAGISVDKMRLLRNESNDGQPSQLEALAEVMRFATELRKQIEKDKVGKLIGQPEGVAGESGKGESQPSAAVDSKEAGSQ